MFRLRYESNPRMEDNVFAYNRLNGERRSQAIRGQGYRGQKRCLGVSLSILPWEALCDAEWLLVNTCINRAALHFYRRLMIIACCSRFLVKRLVKNIQDLGCFYLYQLLKNAK